MKFTTLSHAGLLVEHAGTSLICDPWLIGSCYWRSWWNYPEPSPELIQSLKPDYIYLTHIHWDHFHTPSLRLFPKDTPILVAKFPPKQMAIDLHSIGFHNVHEIPHGGRVELANGFYLYSYQFGIAHDSAAVLTNGDVTLLNANDCKIFGLPLDQIRAKFSNFDFVLRSHSNARVLPYCLEDYEKRLSSFRTNQDSIEMFTNFCLQLRARYAVPFASNHCFLHRDTERFNHTAVRPTNIVEHYTRQATDFGIDSKIAVMPAGSSWSDESGFSLREFDYENPEPYIARMKIKYADKLQRQYQVEENAIFNKESFQAYFERFVRRFSWILRRVKCLRVTFKINDRNGEHYWLVDFSKRIVKPVQASDPFEVMIEMQAKVMNDCTKRLFRVWGPSKRCKVILDDEKYLSHTQYFLTILDLYENDVIPLWMNLKPRSVWVRMRRWREIVEALRLVFQHKVLGKPFKVVDLYLPSQ